MGRIIINSEITQKTDLKERWELLNPTLLKGELGIEIDTNQIKIGDGITEWISLPYIINSISNDEIDKII